ncbi:hypothetical protein GGS23DRAFT_36772 [Durotheca rogersii]|uniref:uncharacterized protein n=1 Tax=Durotheca rogersii TaxID=419775 RepID=UPI00221FA945|nr:uncharacterized protein GGS23DRAFT_36772 [Durotheca rogersii]KAI5868558.1 hypothetical protein GGS23DRAFT_36772 [Durotheca rogersii]
MAAARRARLPVGSAPWISEERSSALQIVQSEVDEFSFSARNDFDWLNEHMAEVFSENQINVADVFKTPGKLRGKTPRTARKLNAGDARVPLSDLFSATPKGAPNPFAMPSINRHNTPKIEIAADPQPSSPKPMGPASSSRHASPAKPVLAASKPPVSMVDSGYHGSQSQDAMDVDDAALVDDEATQPFSPHTDLPSDHVTFQISSDHHEYDSPTRHSPNPAPDMTTGDHSTQYFTAHVAAGTSPTTRNGPPHESTTPAGSPLRSPKPSLESTSPVKSLEAEHTSPAPEDQIAEPEEMEIVPEEPSRSPSDGSSPIRPIVRKSSLNFASLPAREPITHKSIGNRASRTSHLEQTRTSYYSRHTEGRSLGNAKHDLTDDENDDMDTDEDPFGQDPELQSQSDALAHNKTYTQRLQDQISKLGQLQPQVSRPSKSIPDVLTAQPAAPQSQARPFPSPQKTTTPGAFPDDEDDWIQPLGPPDDASDMRSPRPALPKSHSADVMEGVSGKDTIGGGDIMVPKARPRTSRSRSPERAPMSDRSANTFSHHKSASVPVLPLKGLTNSEGDSLKKTITVSNPALAAVSKADQPSTPMKSPARSLRDSPLKQVKNKLSSILKSSKGLLASSAAISAEGKTSLLSPSTARLGLHRDPPTDTFASPKSSPKSKEAHPLYPDLSRHAADTEAPVCAPSPTRAEGRKTRASTEREKAEEKRKEKEAKEARLMAEQMEKLEKAREKEREKARVFSEEQEKAAAMEKQVAAQRDQEKRMAVQTPGNTKPTRVSPRRIKKQPTADKRTAATVYSDETQADIDMTDAPSIMPPPSAARPLAPASATKGREIKRPIRPAKEPVAKPKQAPTVIRVNTGSQHPQFHPSNSTLSSNLHETLSQPQPKGKASQPALQTKPSLQSLKSSTSSLGRPKALDAAARRKEQEEREAQRKRDAKAELERKRTAMQEEERRQEQQRKAEAERQKEEERKQADAKKNAQRQAMLEKAKQTRAPPPAVRSQPNGPPDYSRSEIGAPRPPSRLTTQRPQEDTGRPVNAVLSTASKANTKRPLQQEPNDDNASYQATARGANGYQPKDPKRMRMSDEMDDGMEVEKQPNLKGAPVRPSGGYKKDMPVKSLFPSGYASASLNNNRDLFKATVTSQHNSQLKTAHPLDMTQVSKAPIPFAPNPSTAGSSYKTPARPQGGAVAKSTVKSATRSSPRFQNGDSIELPEINTDDDDDDDDDDDGVRDAIASWADSPNLRKALVRQETQDPMQVFGVPAPLNMEEVFAKSKDRFHKFRARTSSANWSGSDRLTEEDIRKDMAARDQIRRDGGWSYQTVIDYERSARRE